MRHLTLLLITVFLINICFAQTEPQMVTKNYRTGEKQSQGKILGSSEYGKWQYWDRDGNLIQETEFEQGIINGSLIYYYKNGQKQNEGSFYYGVKTGEYKAWYKNGKLKEEGSYKSGIMDSIWTYYFESGKKQKVEEYDDVTGFIKLKDYWDKYEKHTVKDGKGKYQDFYSNGKVKEEGLFKSGLENGKWTLYYKNGQKMSEGKYINGKRAEKWTSWFDNGNIKSELNYNTGDNIQWYINGKKELVDAHG